MASASAPKTKFDPKVERYRGWRGGILAPHRAFARVPLHGRDLATGVLLCAAAVGLWVWALPTVTKAWAAIFAFWAHLLGWHAPIVMVPQQFGPFLHFAVPYVAVPAGPLGSTYWITAFLSVAVFVATFFLSDDAQPAKYLLRAMVFLQATALVYFAVAAARFPHDISGYTVSMLVFGALFITLIPVILGFTYYLFDFTLAQKLALTLMTMGHLALFIPLQYMVHIYVLHHSILLMPLLYFAFGPFLDVLVFVCFYSWGMSWESRHPRPRQRSTNRFIP